MTQICFKCLFLQFALLECTTHRLLPNAILCSQCCNLYVNFNPERLMCREREGAGNLDCIANAFNKINIK